jgi:hypothetical protein
MTVVQLLAENLLYIQTVKMTVGITDEDTIIFSPQFLSSYTHKEFRNNVKKKEKIFSHSFDFLTEFSSLHRETMRIL